MWIRARRCYPLTYTRSCGGGAGCTGEGLMLQRSAASKREDGWRACAHTWTQNGSQASNITGASFFFRKITNFGCSTT